MKTAKDIINSNSLKLNTIESDAMVIEALTLMIAEKTDYVTVKEGNRFIGIIRESDYLSKIILPGKDPEKTKVKDIMSINRWSVNMDEPVYKCLELMDTYKIRHLLVFDDAILMGVITLHDLMIAALEENVDKQLKQLQTKYTASGTSVNEPNMSFDNE